MNDEMLNRVQADIKRKIDCRMGKIPAPLFGEGFSQEQRKITTLTKYLELETWKPTEAAMLVCGLQPPQDCHEIPQGAMGLDNVMVTPYEDRFYDTKRVLQLWNSRENPPNKIRPADFVGWCKTKGINTDWLRDIEPAEPRHEPVPEGKAQQKADAFGKRRVRLYKEVMEIPEWEAMPNTRILKQLREAAGNGSNCILTINQESITWLDENGGKQNTKLDSFSKAIGRIRRDMRGT